ncbi:MAG: M42 family metallopeptidase [Deltaproteobacteria bacterium]|nr:M42 family metallopeptidase [Deltaproteobacteria bacterium]
MAVELRDLLGRLCAAPGPSGQEQAVRDLIAAELKPYSGEIREDGLGNLVVKVGPEGGYRVGVLAHMDEVGFIVSRISGRGLVGFELLGSIDARCLPACEVDLVTTAGRLVRGGIGLKSRHLQTPDDPPLSLKSLSIDLGAGSAAEVEEAGVEVGGGGVFATPFQALPNGIIRAKALDDRIGCLVLMETLKACSSVLKNTTLYGMFTSQEEIGAKGAQVVAFDIRPQLTITLDTVPTKNPDEIGAGDVDLGRGPVIRLFDWHPSTKFGMASHPAITARLKKVAREKKIPYQVDVLTSTYLDSSQVHLTAGGIPGGSICFPRRYSHSPVEVAQLADVRNGLALLTEFISSLDRDPLKFGRVY